MNVVMLTISMTFQMIILTQARSEVLKSTDRGDILENTPMCHSRVHGTINLCGRLMRMI